MRTHDDGLLRHYFRFHEQPYTIGRLIWLNRKLHALTALVFGGLVAFVAIEFGWRYAGYAVTAGAAVLLRDVGHFRRSVRAWPRLDGLIDGDKAAQLADGAGAVVPGNDSSEGR